MVWSVLQSQSQVPNMSSDLPLKMFVYGTLMRGFSNHHIISNCRFLGSARTVEKFELYVGSYPFVPSSIEETYVHGELYEVQNVEDLKGLDQLEGHPDDYCRSDCVVVLQGTDEPIAAQIYFNNNCSLDGAEHVPSGSFKDAILAHKYMPDLNRVE